MLAVIDWQSLGVLAGLIGTVGTVHVILIVANLRGMRLDLAQHELTDQNRMVRLEDNIAAVRQNYATKEEWVRESMHTRKSLERQGDVLNEIKGSLASNSNAGNQIAAVLTSLLNERREHHA